MESLSVSSRIPLPCSPAIRHVDLEPAFRRLHFPRPSAPRHRTVCCSHAVPPPKEREANKKGRWKAAAVGTAAAVVCALGAVYLSKAQPPPPAKPPGTEETQVYIVSKESEDDDDDESPEDNEVLSTTRDELHEILFKKGRCGVPNLIESWVSGPMRFDAALMVVQWHIAKKDYRAAEEICKKTIKMGSQSQADARPHLLMTVIQMMLAVEAMLQPEAGEEDPEVYVKRAMVSWNEFRGSVGRNIPVE